MDYIVNAKSIDNLDSDELRVYTALSEPQLFHYNEPEPGLFIAESPMIIERAIEAGYQAESFLVEDTYLDGMHSAKEILALIKNRNDRNAPVYTAPLAELKKMTGYTITRGILSAMKRKVMAAPEQIIENLSRIVVMEDVMNPTNLGAIFRSAAALGVEAVLLTGGCTDPLYRRSSRVSMGTVFQIPWTYVNNWFPDESSESSAHPGIQMLHEHGFKTVAMALKDESINMKDLNPKPGEKIAFIMGSEGPGLREETINACDLTVKIPMFNGVDSLNVAAASAIAFWQIMK